MVWTKLFDLGSCFFEGYTCYVFLNHFLKPRSKKTWFSVTVVGGLMLCLFAVNQLKIAGLNLLAATTLCFIMGQILFSSALRKKLFYVMVCVFIMLCSEFVVIAIYNLPLGNHTIDFVNDPIKGVMALLTIKLLAFLVVRIICHVSDNGKTMFFPSLVPYFCCFPISCAIVYLGITYSEISFVNATPSTYIILAGCILLLVANVVLFILYDRIIFIMNQLKDYELTDIKRNLENQHYLQVEEINRKHTEILHDMNNYLNTIESLALKENNEKIVDIIESLNQHIVKVEEEHYCNHQILNAILNGKKQEALVKKVNYEVYVELGFEKPDVKDIDLISIMSNLIDNAIEAASKCADGYVDIQLYKANDGRFTTIKITNNYVEKPKEKDGEFISRKDNPSMHGIGLRHVKSIVESYGGWANIEYGDDKFCVTIMFA